MLKPNKLCLFLFLFFFSLTLPCFADDSILWVTYYPAPYGAYKEMRAMRMAVGDHYVRGEQYYWDGTGPGEEIDANADLIVEGNVGIGTTTPNAPYTTSPLLHLYGTTPWIRIEGTATSAGTSVGLEIISNGKTTSISNEEGRLSFFNSSNEKMSILSNGNVGIGTTEPQAKLDVNGGIRVGSDSTCNTDKTGTMRYNSRIEYCDGSIWKSVGARTWQTDWFSADQGNTKVFDHPLGSKYLMTAILWSPNASYTPIYNIGYFVYGSYGYGAEITSITDTQLTVQIGNRWIEYFTSTGAPPPDTHGGYYKVLATRID